MSSALAPLLLEVLPMRDLVLASLTEHQLGVVERHLAKELHSKKLLSNDARLSVVAYYLRILVELRIRQTEGRLESAMETLFEDQLNQD
jgi:hypothetical protein